MLRTPTSSPQTSDRFSSLPSSLTARNKCSSFGDSTIYRLLAVATICKWCPHLAELNAGGVPAGFARDGLRAKASHQIGY